MTIRRAGRPDLLLLHLRNSALPKALNLYHGTSGARSEDCPCSCAFLLIHLRPNATVCFIFLFWQKAEMVLRKKTIKILFFKRTVKLWKCSGKIAATLYINIKLLILLIIYIESTVIIFFQALAKTLLLFSPIVHSTFQILGYCEKFFNTKKITFLVQNTFVFFCIIGRPGSVSRIQ